jgi:nitrile hydratase accessory protein
MPSTNCPPTPNYALLPGLPQDDDSVVFAAPWEAKAFALVVNMHQRGYFPWTAWVETLSAEIAADAAARADTPYYLLWLAAAEKLIATLGLVEAGTLQAACAALREAQKAMHEQPHDHDHDHDTHHHPH